MKKISVREFQLHAKQYLAELPIELTQYNVVVATIISPKGVEEIRELDARVNRSVNTESELGKIPKTATETYLARIREPKVAKILPKVNKLEEELTNGKPILEPPSRPLSSQFRGPLLKTDLKGGKLK